MSWIRNSCSSSPRVFSVRSQDFHLLYTKFNPYVDICLQFSYYVTISNHWFLGSVTVFSFTFFLQMSGFKRLLLFSEAISLHSLLGCNWTSWRHQYPLLIGLSPYGHTSSPPRSRCCYLDGASRCHHLVYPHRWSASCGQMFETCNSNHQAEKTRLLLSLPQFCIRSPIDSISINCSHGESPKTSLPLLIVQLFVFNFSGWAPHWAPIVTWSVLGPAQLRKVNAVFK